MAHPIKHAESSARKFGGKAEDYLAIHNWFDESKAFLSDFRHRALRHHAEGIFLCEKVFGTAITNSGTTLLPGLWGGDGEGASPRRNCRALRRSHPLRVVWRAFRTAARLLRHSSCWSAAAWFAS